MENDIYTLNLNITYKDKTNIVMNNNILNIILNINKLSTFKLIKKINSLINILNIFNVTTVNINFDNINNDYDIIKIITNIHNLLYKYKKKINITINNEYYKNIINELNNYKDIVLNPDKTPESYYNYIVSNIPDKYEYIKLKEEYFPLTIGVGAGSIYKSKAYMLHIKPKVIDESKKDIYLVGKAITYDSGGMNIKPSQMEYMKIDMTGSAILLTVLKLLNYDNFDKFNIHLVIPIAENMVGNTAIKPGDVIKTYDNKKIEIHNTDAEGRLCMADALVYINNNLITKPNSFILDIATLTGNTIRITDNSSAVVLSNKLGKEYYEKLYNIGENIGEYVDYLNIREEHLLKLKSEVADIKNTSSITSSETVIAGAFLKYFVKDTIPWIHIDVANITYNKNSDTALNYGVMLLYNFIKTIEDNTKLNYPAIHT